jgi:hypothetical protein
VGCGLSIPLGQTLVLASGKHRSVVAVSNFGASLHGVEIRPIAETGSFQASAKSNAATSIDKPGDFRARVWRVDPFRPLKCLFPLNSTLQFKVHIFFRSSVGRCCQANVENISASRRPPKSPAQLGLYQTIFEALPDYSMKMVSIESQQTQHPVR